MAEATIIANIQKVGALRFYGAPSKGQPLGPMTEIPVGTEAPVPAKTWSRYKDREDVKAMHGTHIVIGGFGSVTPEQLTIPIGQRAVMAAHKAEMTEARADLERRMADLEARERKLETAMGGSN